MLATPPAFALPATPSVTVPVAYGLVGVSAADDKDRPEPDDQPLGPLVPRVGNEGPVGGPATVYQVWRQEPPSPDAPFDVAKLSATRADFRSQSFFTHHFPKQANLSTNVFRALDETLFLIDSATDKTRRNDEVALITATALGWFKNGHEDTVRRDQAVSLISALPPQTPTPPGPADYAKLSDDALRILASTKTNIAAFSRITNPALVPNTPDEHGLSDPPDYDPNAHPTTSAFTDTLDGRAANRYFYRTSYVDAAQNASKQLGLSTPPVYLPVTALPHPVQFTRVLGDDGGIVLVWPDLADPGITSYRLFRTRDENATANIRTMDRFPNTVAAGSGKNGQITFTDFDVQPLVDYFYRLVSIGPTGVESEPSAVGRTHAFRLDPPLRPELLSVQRLTAPVLAFRITWAAAADLAILVQRRAVGSPGWTSVGGGWLSAGTTSVDDAAVEAGKQYEYRVRGRDATGVQTDLSETISDGRGVDGASMADSVPRFAMPVAHDPTTGTVTPGPRTFRQPLLSSTVPNTVAGLEFRISQDNTAVFACLDGSLSWTPAQTNVPSRLTLAVEGISGKKGLRAVPTLEAVPAQIIYENIDDATLQATLVATIKQAYEGR